MTDETDITVNDIAEVIWDGMVNGATVFEIAEAVAKIVNDKWYGSRKDICERIIGGWRDMTKDEQKLYWKLISEGLTREDAINAVRDVREGQDEML